MLEPVTMGVDKDIYLYFTSINCLRGLPVEAGFRKLTSHGFDPASPARPGCITILIKQPQRGGMHTTKTRIYNL